MFIYINAGEDKWIEVNSRRDLARFAWFNHFRQTKLKSVTNWGLKIRIFWFCRTQLFIKEYERVGQAWPPYKFWAVLVLEHFWENSEMKKTEAKCSRTLKWLKTCEGVKFDLLFRIL